MEDLGFAERGMAWKEVLAGTFDLEGELPVNPDGGLKSFGHPIGASGLRMLFEAWLQLRREAPEARQIQSVAIGQVEGAHAQPRRRAAAPASASCRSSGPSWAEPPRRRVNRRHRGSAGRGATTGPRGDTK